MPRIDTMPLLRIHSNQTCETSRGRGRPPRSSSLALRRLYHTAMAWAMSLALLMFLVPAASAQVPVNNCADSSNQGILRCALFPDAPPYLQPSGPSAPGDVKTFTRVFLLADEAVRCFDGTAPTLYVDPAVDAAGTTIVSSKWLFTLTGGGSCAPVDSDSDGMVDDLTACLHAFATQPNEMSSTASKPMQNFFGVHSADPLRNPAVAHGKPPSRQE